MTLPINNVAGWRYISQRKQTQIEKDVICENSTIVNYNYRMVDQVMTGDKAKFKYETPFKGPYENVQMWTNRSVNLRIVVVVTRVNIRHIKPY